MATLARVLDAPLDEALVRSGLASKQAAAAASQPGFSDSDAAIWLPSNGPETEPEKAMATALGARAGVDVWTVRTRAMSLAGYLPGDRMLVDMHRADDARSGDVVVAQAYDVAAGSAKTVLRQYQRPALVAHSADPADWRVLLVDDDAVVIRGLVTASWRTRAA